VPGQAEHTRTKPPGENVPVGQGIQYEDDVNPMFLGTKAKFGSQLMTGTTIWWLGADVPNRIAMMHNVGRERVVDPAGTLNGKVERNGEKTTLEE